jgi:hypothetical protein
LLAARLAVVDADHVACHLHTSDSANARQLRLVDSDVTTTSAILATYASDEG